MITFKQFLSESVIYNKPDPERMSDEEHNETTHQSQAIKDGNMNVHPAIASAIHKFAQNKPSFTKALRQSKIQRVQKGTEVNNSEIGQSKSNIEDRTKVNRVKKQIGSGEGIDRPIILRHKDPSTGQTHHHLLAGNTRATTVGYGIQAHHIDV